ncbi:LOW QUALITY PROTEIN: uncharacterized protein LOC130772005 [Actinidia eriantha]|uniref:LOW QUALITY PROTEIN: uncharacterized protein LOC130772005 n=1 Tax=Actinidia eriantha TaxID=165200 RepID=UPI00258BF9AF|nr:LOW QUALITY PROTEIN: uncharacterized protein LOC130772005 [Actinidia eriantha]
MEMEVVGRHVLFFDDDATAAFVNSGDALVDWNSLLIDRYDVRHLLSAPPPPRRRRNPHSPPSASSIESELDSERFLDLPSPLDDQELDERAKPDVPGGYHNVAFSYGNTDDSTDQMNPDDGLGDLGFQPPFPVPESLLQSLPPTEKIHQIIARTATFVSKHGGQSEIVLRVKQGDNPTFGFLMPDHHLHAYFRFLVDHQDLLQSDVDGKSEAAKKGGSEVSQTDGVGAGALFLLGSVYGSGEDDAAVENSPESKETASGPTVSHASEKTETSGNLDGKDEAVGKHPSPRKEKVVILRRNSFLSAPKFGKLNSKRKEGDPIGLLSAAMDEPQPSALPNISQVEQLLLEPPSDIKRLVDKIVEFIMRNGKQFEAVLVEQDSKHGRFPFLIPSNQYHPYYVKVLQKAQESKLNGKSFISVKDGSVVMKLDKKTYLSKETDPSSGSTDYDIPYDGDRKEKFKMVIGKSKKDGQDPPYKANQPQFGVNVDAAAAAAILQAATRGTKNPNFGILSSTSLNGDKSAKTAALEAANEADSSESHLTKEQKLKAERLRRAKMFVAMLKNGAAPSKTEPLRSLSVEPQGTGVSSSGDGVVDLSGKEREGIYVPLDVNTSDKIEKYEKKYSDENHERRLRRKYRSRSGRCEEVGEEEEDEEEEEEEDHKHSRKKHRSHQSSREEGKEEDEEEREHRYARKKHQSYCSSHEEDGKEDGEDERDHKHSRKKHRSHRSSHENDKDEDYENGRHHKHSKKKHRSHRSSRHSRDRHKHKELHSSSKNKESRHRHKQESSSDDEHLRRSSSSRHWKISHSEEELEEGEICYKISDRSRGSVGAGISREDSLDLSSSYQDGRAPSQPSEATEVPDELRAKIRAMLMATL